MKTTHPVFDVAVCPSLQFLLFCVVAQELHVIVDDEIEARRHSPNSKFPINDRDTASSHLSTLCLARQRRDKKESRVLTSVHHSSTLASSTW